MKKTNPPAKPHSSAPMGKLPQSAKEIAAKVLRNLAKSDHDLSALTAAKKLESKPSR